MSDTCVVCTNLSFSWPDDTPVFQDLSFTVPPGRTGLVAPNGAGKTTLLRLIAGDLTPTGGAVTVDGVLGYLPQNLPLAGDLTVAQVLGVDAVLRALHAIEAGDAAEEHFTTVGDDWDVEERSRAELDRLGLGDVALDRRLATLSGGQVVSLGLAAQLLRRPDVLLLDEPTNNLDLDARHRLYAVLEEWSGCLLLVSHDRALLDRMDRIAELDRGELRLFGGNFTAYEEAARAAREAAERTVRGAEQEVKREKREMQQARERAERRAGNAARNLDSAGLARIVAGGLKRSAQESAGRSRQLHANRVSEAQSRLDEASRALREDETLTLDLPDTTVPAGRTVVAGERMQVHHDGRAVFAGAGLDLTIRGPERIALTGPNGAGKSTLLRLLQGELDPEGGQLRRGEGRVAYLSQRLDLLDPERTVAENFAAYAPDRPQAERMNLLARFLFRGARAHLPVGVLSGGERLRATLACVLYAQPAPHLLLLDEPTNNLDLVSAGQLESALSAYRGAFVVVSHDERFLAEIGVQRWLRLDGGRLREVAAPDLG
ncbi:ATP-binding cassette domain-containing protein [Micromonospora terminaliae]|uniref:ATP-binding cassette domain-containing protein n=1 Tax=Micromonospora terminaliae TaxID=1914461 RepID=A0AAJ3DI04_9ACTN|nr:ABC-F family ATP-binding cassette domain-containing protein [Micromonospora terminaliae]NES27167.1 ABC-F family ATP-binding cassette domain-containing protein [Micromonospora terminaliae]QGL48071.1 ATP-binding cassette domain-containing protein [Micromonospora terminaliae]